MDAMTMSFPVRDDPQVFEILRAGDRLEAKLVVDDGDYWLEKVLPKGFVATTGAGTPAALPTARGVAAEPNRGIPDADPSPDFALTDQTRPPLRRPELR